uniref:Molybdate ABC transporter substrate-binding protein n=1 Tax=Thermosphaera aggregans TaxID=54254 RepID=A0A7C2BJZ4_9CREN
MTHRAYLILSLVGLILIASFSIYRSLTTVMSQEIMFLLPPALYKPLQPSIDYFNSNSSTYKIAVYVQATGSLITRIKLSGEGDVFGAADSEYMQNMLEEGLVYGDKVFVISYSIPALIVPKDNPHNITCLEDLLSKNVKIAIANPDVAPSGRMAVNLLKYNGVYETLKDRLVILADIGELARQVSLGLVDVAITYHFVHYWYVNETDIVWLDPNEIPGIDCQLIGVLTTSKNPELAENILKTVLDHASKSGGLSKLGYYPTFNDLRKITPYDEFTWQVPYICHLGGTHG